MRHLGHRGEARGQDRRVDARGPQGLLRHLQRLRLRAAQRRLRDAARQRVQPVPRARREGRDRLIFE